MKISLLKSVCVCVAIVAGFVMISCGSSGGQDPGEILTGRENDLPRPGQFRSWERGDEVAAALRQILTTREATPEQLQKLGDEANLYISIPAQARLRQMQNSASTDPGGKALFEKVPGAAPTLTLDRVDIRLELFRPDFPVEPAAPIDMRRLTAGFDALENADELSESDKAALTHKGAVFARLVKPEGYDLVIMPDGSLSGSSAPVDGLWRLATSKFADVARKEFALFHLRENSAGDPIRAAIFAAHAGLDNTARKVLREIVDKSPADDPKRGGALFVLHEIERPRDEKGAMKILESLVFDFPGHEFVKSIGFWRLAAFYNKERMWPETLKLYRGPGAVLKLSDSIETRRRLKTIDFALATSAKWKENPEEVGYRQKIKTFHAYERLGDYQMALAWVDFVIEENMPDRPEFLVEKARCLMKLRRWDEAEQTLKFLLADEKNSFVKSGKIYESFIELYRAQARDDMVKWAEDMYAKKSAVYHSNLANRFESRKMEDAPRPPAAPKPQNDPGLKTE